MVNCRWSDQFKNHFAPNNCKSGTGRSPTQSRRPTPDCSFPYYRTKKSAREEGNLRPNRQATPHTSLDEPDRHRHRSPLDKLSLHGCGIEPQPCLPSLPAALPSNLHDSPPPAANRLATSTCINSKTNRSRTCPNTKHRQQTRCRQSVPMLKHASAPIERPLQPISPPEKQPSLRQHEKKFSSWSI